MRSLAAALYSLLSEFHALAAASNGPGPGPLLSSAECTSGGKAAQIGDVMVGKAACRTAHGRVPVQPYTA